MIASWVTTIATMELVRDEELNVVGLIFSNDIGTIVNELWTAEGCRRLQEAGQIICDEETHPTAEELEKRFIARDLAQRGLWLRLLQLLKLDPEQEEDTNGVAN